MGGSSSYSSTSTSNTTSTTTATIANAFNNALNTTQSFSNIGNVPTQAGDTYINWAIIIGGVLAAIALFFVMRKR